MRLGKEQSVGVIEEPAGTGSIPRDEPRETCSDGHRAHGERAEDTSRSTGSPRLSEQGAFVPSR